jgi:nicotinamide mononucleotide transporter
VAAALDAAVAALASIPPAEWVAVLLAFAYLLLAVRQNAWCWACAIASSAIYLVLFAEAGLVMQSALQLFYIAMGAYGWWSWRHGAGGAGTTPAVSRWPLRRHLALVAAVVVVTMVNGALVGGGERGALPYVDAFVAWASVVATWLVARKLLENWLYWIVIDSAAAALYASQGLRATAILFVVYVGIAVHGYFTWRADLARAPREPVVPADA